MLIDTVFLLHLCLRTQAIVHIRNNNDSFILYWWELKEFLEIIEIYFFKKTKNIKKIHSSHMQEN